MPGRGAGQGERPASRTSNDVCRLDDVEAGGGNAAAAAARHATAAARPTTTPTSAWGGGNASAAARRATTTTPSSAWGGGGKVATTTAPPPISRSSSAAVLAAEDAALAAAGTAWARPAAARAAAARIVEGRPWRWGVISLVVADLAVVLAEVALSGAHPELEACRERPPAARAAAEGLHVTTLTLLVALNAEWLIRVCVLGPFHFFRVWQHWLDASLVVLALALEVALHGSAAVTANLGLIILRLARVGHALVELSMTEAHYEQRGRRARAVGLVWRLAATAAVAQARAAEAHKGRSAV